jgi:hypothetical protein
VRYGGQGLFIWNKWLLYQLLPKKNVHIAIAKTNKEKQDVEEELDAIPKTVSTSF